MTRIAIVSDIHGNRTAFEAVLADLRQAAPDFAAIEEMAEVTREALGEERLAWLRGLPRIQMHGPMALVHASPESPWRAPMPEASDAELERVYGPTDRFQMP